MEGGGVISTSSGGQSDSEPGSIDRCWKVNRVRDEICLRHSVVEKMLRIISEQHEVRWEQMAACRHEHRVADPRSLPRQNSRGFEGHGQCALFRSTSGDIFDRASYDRDGMKEKTAADEEALDDERTHDGGGQTLHLPTLSGMDMNLGTVLPDITLVANQDSNISFQATILHLSSFSEAERSVPPSPILAEDAAPFHAAFDYNISESFVARHAGLVLAAVHNVTVVHDGVVCNSTHSVTALGVKHPDHPIVHKMHGCQLPDQDPAIRLLQRALLLVRYMGWF